MFGGNEMTSRKNSWKIGSHLSSLQGASLLDHSDVIRNSSHLSNWALLCFTANWGYINVEGKFCYIIYITLDNQLTGD